MMTTLSLSAKMVEYMCLHFLLIHIPYLNPKLFSFKFYPKWYVSIKAFGAKLYREMHSQLAWTGCYRQK